MTKKASHGKIAAAEMTPAAAQSPEFLKLVHNTTAEAIARAISIEAAEHLRSLPVGTFQAGIKWRWSVRIERKSGRKLGSTNKTERSKRMTKLDDDMVWVMGRYAEEYGINDAETLVKRIQKDRPDIQIGQSKEADKKRLAKKYAARRKN